MLGPRKSIEKLSQRDSGHSLAKTLSWPHLIALGVGAIVGTGIYTLTGVGADARQCVDAGADDRADAKGDQVRPAQCLGEGVSGIALRQFFYGFTRSEHSVPPIWFSRSERQ